MRLKHAKFQSGIYFRNRCAYEKIYNYKSDLLLILSGVWKALVVILFQLILAHYVKCKEVFLVMGTESNASRVDRIMFL
jgi:hypothetical protein